jgi:glycosyltransferase involved in cell wall biosynthesis
MKTDRAPDAPPAKAPISAIILTRNEEANIAGALENILDLVDELIVIDMQSEDKTVEIASRYTSHIFSHPLIPGFDAARNVGHDNSTHDWILILDADERLPSKLKSKFREIVDKDLGDYVETDRLNFILGHPLSHGYHGRDPQIHFYKKSCATPWPETVHIAPRFTGRKLRLPHDADLTILHYTSPTIEALLSRLQRYTRQEAIQLDALGYAFSPLKLVAKPVWFFIDSYFLRQGFRDGTPGLIYAVYYAFYFFIGRARFWENKHSEKLVGKR